MPAMPIAERRPPIVVGMRVTSSATRTTTESTVPEYPASPHNVTTAIRKMSVMPERRTESASSFGVFCRSAPSTSAIMRSMKVEPGAAVTRTLIQSESTVVPPVTRGAIAAGFADNRRRFTGDRGFVHRGNALDDVAVRRNEIAGLDQHDVTDLQIERVHAFIDVAEGFRIEQPLGVRVASRPTQARGLCFAASFRHRFGKR